MKPGKLGFIASLQGTNFGQTQRWANSGLGQTKNFWSGENPDQFFWSGIWSGGLANIIFFYFGQN